jgi:hypothetical protein
MKAILYKDVYHTITDEIRDGKYITHPIGGGFQVALPVEECLLTDMPNKIIECHATVDDGSTWYPCTANPHNLWNGWAQPTFTKETAIKILEESKYQKASQQLRNHKEGEFSFVVNDYGNGDVEEATLYLSDDGSVSFYGWCWELCDNNGKYL